MDTTFRRPWDNAISLLTPGDFAVVARKSEVFCERDPERLALWLEDEVRAKPNFKRQKIGF
jgi:hypothetical protein